MAIIDVLRRQAVNFFVERPFKLKSFVEMAEIMETSAQDLDGRIVAAEDSAENQEVLRHIIGIERWGHTRLQAFLDDTSPTDEYDAYRPNDADSFEELRQIFHETRQETKRLIHEIDGAGTMSYEKVRHNQHGDLSVRGWNGCAIWNFIPAPKDVA